VLGVAIIVAGLAASGSIAAQPGPVTIKLGVTVPPGHPAVQSLQQVAVMLDKRSSGRVKMQIFPGGQLGSTLDNIDQVSKGTIQMSMVNPSITAQVVPEMGVFAAPFLFPSLEAVYKAAASPTGQRITDKLRTEKGIRALDPWYLGGWNLFTNKRLVHKCDDLKGMKLRVPASPVLKDFFERCGAGVVAMDFSEVYLSLNTGVIDGIPMPLAIMESGKLHEVVKFGTLSTYLYDLFHPLVSEKFWSTLSPGDQKLLVDVFAEGRKINDSTAMKVEAAAVDLFVQKKITLDRNVDVESFREAAKKTWEVFRDRWGGTQTIEALQAAGRT
jgi:tripartite ATP-independent transporter DctP family solute receptor